MIDRTFINEVAAGTPTPGGGGAAAYCGALGSALSSMVGNLTVGKKRYADVEDDVRAHLEQLYTVREELLELVERDAQAFAPLADAFRLPKETQEQQVRRHEVIQAALIDAIEVPFSIMNACARVIELSDFLAYHGTRTAVSDVATGVSFAKGALKGAALNVYVNAAMLDDKTQARRYTDEADRLIEESGRRADEIYNYVLEEIR
ncbi:MAG: cyclodeaminase/cyclohydrolase family protein [Eggerthellaceae bacterium]